MSDPTAALEEILARSNAGERELRLYVNGQTLRGLLALG
jgi:hypothetical protein